MKKYDFIFSNRFIPKVSRQIVFWTCFLLYFFYVNLLPASTRDLFLSKTYFRSFQLMIYAPVSMLAVYIAIFILLPRFIYPGKYLALLGLMIVLSACYFSMAWFITYLYADLSQKLPYHVLPVSFRWFLPVRYGIGFPLTSTVLVIIVKLFKNYQLKQKEQELLLRQKINTELQILKTRFKPQFLYNALQHISFLIRNQSVESPSALLKLSDLLSYVLYEHEKESVRLENELEILKTFCMLKNALNSGVFRIHFNYQISSGNLFISPLILLSIFENCLDQLYQIGERPVFINMIIKTIKNDLHFQLECKEDVKDSGQHDAYFNRLQQSLERMELLYAGEKKPDLFIENGTTYLILEFTLTEVSPSHKKTFQMALEV